MTLKVSVSNTALNKAITLKTQAKLNLTTGQKMVLIPTLKGVGGPITDVAISDEKNFAVEYNEDLNQIIVSPAEGAALDAKTTYPVTLTVTAGGFECPIEQKFKPAVTGVTVKISAVTIPGSKMSGENSAEANVLCTFKQGGKTFAIAPTDVTFTGAKDEGEGWFTYSLSKSATCLVKYNEDKGTISVKNATGKGSVKVELTFPGGKTVKKSLSIKQGNN